MNNNNNKVDSISYELAKWIHIRLINTGQIRLDEAMHTNDISSENKPLLINILYGLVDDQILQVETSYNENTEKEEKIFYSRKIVV